MPAAIERLQRGYPLHDINRWLPKRKQVDRQIAVVIMLCGSRLQTNKVLIVLVIRALCLILVKAWATLALNFGRWAVALVCGVLKMTSNAPPVMTPNEFAAASQVPAFAEVQAHTLHHTTAL